MERVDTQNTLDERYAMVCDALVCLDDALEGVQKYGDDPFSKEYKLMRSAAIHNFETFIDTFWKFIKNYLEVEGIPYALPSPKQIFTAAADAGILKKSDVPAFFRMIDDRNITSHTYRELIAEEIKGRLPGYYELLNQVVYSIKLP